MRKDEFFKQLEYLLQDISGAEREEAINYYRDYLDEAGPEKEGEVLREFGSPERIAAIIRSDAFGYLEDSGSFTEKGYEDERFREPNHQLANRMDGSKDGTDGGTHRVHDQSQRKDEWNKSDRSETVHDEDKTRTSGWLKIVLFAILLVVAVPGIFRVGGTALGMLVSVVVTAVVLLFLAALLTIVFLFVGVVLVGAGITFFWKDPLDGVLAVGFGLLIAGLGLLALVFSVWFYGKLVPWTFRWIRKGLDTVSDWMRRRNK